MNYFLFFLVFQDKLHSVFETQNNMDYLFHSQIEFILKKRAGIKTCLFDTETRQIISNLIPLSMFQDHDYFYFDYITNRNRIAVEGMQCAIIIRPSSLKALIEELDHPFYSNYIVLFTSQIDPFVLDIIANADIKSVISEIHEINLDLFKQSSHLYTINSVEYKRILDGLLSLIFSLEIEPHIKIFDEKNVADLSVSDIKYENETTNFFDLSKELLSKSKEYKFSKKGTLILLKRNYDLVTPLLYDWHYQPMIYEHFNVDNSHFTLENKEISLIDKFFHDNRFLEIDTVGKNIKEEIKQIERKQKLITTQNFDDMEQTILIKNKLESHLKIFTNLIDKCMKFKNLSEKENQILLGNVDIKLLIENEDPDNALILLLIYCLKHIKYWENSFEYENFKDPILKFLELFRPKNYSYKGTFNNEVDIKLGYISPITRIIRHIINKKIKENAFLMINEDLKEISPIIIYIEGGISMREYREAMLCETEYNVDIILVSDEIINRSKILQKIKK